MEMKKIKINNMNKEISQIGFGGLALKNMPLEGGMRLVYHAYEKGVNFFDTARSYGHSEAIIGRGLYGFRENIIICSKTKVKRIKPLMDDLEESLYNLKTDYIDIFMLHDVRNLNMMFYDNLEALTLEKTVKKVGVSVHRLEILEEIVKQGMVDVVMFPFNFIESEALNTGLIDKCRKKNIGMVIMKPIGGGMIRYPEKSLQWIGRTLKDAIIIPGMKTKEEVDINTNLFEKSLKFPRNFPELWEEKSRLGHRFCRRCEYCCVCPEGINPSIIIQWRELMMKRDEGFLSDNKLKQIKAGLECKQCGLCEEACPYNLKLTELVPQETRRILEKVGKYEHSKT